MYRLILTILQGLITNFTFIVVLTLYGTSSVVKLMKNMLLLQKDFMKLFLHTSQYSSYLLLQLH